MEQHEETIDRLQLEYQSRSTFPMTQKQKLLQKILFGSNNIAFDDMVVLVQAFGFRLSRVNGSHHIFENTAIGEQINIQNKKGKAKPYQIKQFLQLVEQYNLNLNSVGENE